MPPRYIIEIKPHRYGWTCEETFGGTRVFILKAQAIQFAQNQCGSVAAEIRVCDRCGEVAETLRVEPQCAFVAAEFRVTRRAAAVMSRVSRDIRAQLASPRRFLDCARNDTIIVGLFMKKLTAF